MTKRKRPSSSTDAAEFLDDLLGQPASLGQTLHALRLGEEQTQAVFAARLGVTKQHLSDVENERRGVGLERAAAWAAALGQSPALFIELAVQSQLRSACLPFVVKIHAAPKSRGRRPSRRAA